MRWHILYACKHLFCCFISRSVCSNVRARAIAEFTYCTHALRCCCGCCGSWLAYAPPRMHDSQQIARPDGISNCIEHHINYDCSYGQILVSERNSIVRTDIYLHTYICSRMKKKWLGAVCVLCMPRPTYILATAACISMYASAATPFISKSTIVSAISFIFLRLHFAFRRSLVRYTFIRRTAIAQNQNATISSNHFWLYCIVVSCCCLALFRCYCARAPSDIHCELSISGRWTTNLTRKRRESVRESTKCTSYQSNKVLLSIENLRRLAPAIQ